jgi:hypothetical protein
LYFWFENVPSGNPVGVVRKLHLHSCDYVHDIKNSEGSCPQKKMFWTSSDTVLSANAWLFKITSFNKQSNFHI